MRGFNCGLRCSKHASATYQQAQIASSGHTTPRPTARLRSALVGAESELEKITKGAGCCRASTETCCYTSNLTPGPIQRVRTSFRLLAVGRQTRSRRMSSSIQNSCAQCGVEIHEDPHAPTLQRRACPSCGSLSRHIKMTSTATATHEVAMSFKAKRPSVKRPIYEGLSKPSVQRTTGILMRLERFFDRLKDRYLERVTNPVTREVVHSCDEPLSAHRGHGSAKQPSSRGTQQAVQGDGPASSGSSP